MYKYFVSYSFENNGMMGNGMNEIKTENKINSYKDIMGVRDIILEGTKWSGVIIMNYILLEQ